MPRPKQLRVPMGSYGAHWRVGDAHATLFTPPLRASDSMPDHAVLLLGTVGRLESDPAFAMAMWAWIKEKMERPHG